MNLDHPVRRSLWIAAGYLLLAVMLSELRRRQVVSAETVERLMGMAMGTVTIVSANALPKRLMPLASLSCDPVREQGLRRFSAWALVLGGLGFTLAYAFAPIAIAAPLAITLLMPTCVVVAGVVARCAWKRRSAKRGRA